MLQINVHFMKTVQTLI